MPPLLTADHRNLSHTSMVKSRACVYLLQSNNAQETDRPVRVNRHGQVPQVPAAARHSNTNLCSQHSMHRRLCAVVDNRRLGQRISGIRMDS